MEQVADVFGVGPGLAGLTAAARTGRGTAVGPGCMMRSDGRAVDICEIIAGYYRQVGVTWDGGTALASPGGPSVI